MKLALILATLTLAAPLARAADLTTGVFDLQKAIAGSDEGKKNAGDEKADFDKKQAEVTKAQDDAAKADAACAKTKPPTNTAIMTTGKTKACVDADAAKIHAQELGQRYQQEVTQRQQQDAQRLVERVNRILPAIAKAKRLGAVVPVGGVFYATPALDQTAEVTRRLNVGEGAADQVADANARAEKAEERARLAEAEVARIRKLGLKATGIAKTAIDERDKAIKTASESLDLSRRALGMPPVDPDAPIAKK